MMKKFVLVVCGSFVGLTLALIVFTVASVAFSFALLGSLSAGSPASVDNNSILQITLRGSIPERDEDGGVTVTDLVRGSESAVGLETLTKAIKEAATNPKVKGIFIDCQGAQAAPATLYELRAAIDDFKRTSRKWVYAYGGAALTQGDYYVATAADSIFLNPVGCLDLHGLAAVIPSYKGLLDKAGVEMQVLRVGAFKSAVEPYILDSISPANRLQQQHYMGHIWACMVGAMAKARDLSVERINELADTVMPAIDPQELVKLKLVDALCYKSEMENRLKQLTDVDASKDLHYVSPTTLASTAAPSQGNEGEIAVLYAVGEIDGTSVGIDSEDFISELKSLANDDHVKGVVLRVNSPGGSAYGSEQMWRAVQDFKATGKPIAVSMGDYAASGGYYMSCGADRIFAEPVTVTGSIGIFGLVPNLKGLLNNKLGVRYSVVKTNKNADFGNISEPMTPVQRVMMQGYVNRGYELFTKRCAEGRDMKQDSIKAIAEGRVWDGESALKLGLVDELGGIGNAVCYVATRAKLKSGNYSVVSYPAPENKWVRMWKQYSGGIIESRMQSQMGVFFAYWKELQNILGRQQVLCMMEPMEIK